MIRLCLYIIMFTFILCIGGCWPEQQTTGCKISAANNYDADADIADNCLCKYDGIFENCGIENPSSISINPIQQETEVWCWLAVGEMVFRHYSLPNVNPGGDYQCGIIGALGYSINGACDNCNINCANCVRPAGSADMVSKMLTTYPLVACRDLFESQKTLKQTFVSDYLAPGFLKNELDNGRPVIAGINPGSQFILPGNSAHVALITGYYLDNLNNLILRVNDPFPYWVKGFDPYIYNGALSNGDLSYQIPYGNFVNGLLWNTSWYGIQW